MMVAFIFSSISFYYQLDGIILLFLLSELSVFLIFLVLYSQIYSFVNRVFKNKYKVITYVFLLTIFNYSETPLILHANFYATHNIVYNDFFVIYEYFFENQILITFLILLIITVYSVFFIHMYFIVQKKNNKEQKKINKLTLLRKQNILHQSNYNSSIKNFQKKQQ